MFSQYSDPTARRVVDNAERASLSPSSIGDAVTTSGIGSITLEYGSTTLGTAEDARLLVISPKLKFNGTTGNGRSFLLDSVEFSEVVIIQ